MKIDKYTTLARVFPSMIGIIPIILFYNFSDWILLKEINQALEVKIISNISLTLVLTFLLMLIVRYISKEYERILFKDEKNFPTTDFLLWKDKTLSERYKKSIRKKIKVDFDIDLFDINTESENISEARILISEAVGRVRNKVGKGKLLLNHNIEYGFARNLIGASLFGFITSLIFMIIMIINNIQTKWVLFGIISFIFLGYLIISKSAIKKLGKLYAKRLFIEYLN